MAKARRRPSNRDNLRQPATSVGERVSTDIKEVNTVALGGHRYCCIFVDEYSGEKCVYPMRRKNDLVDAALRPYLAYMKSMGHKVKSSLVTVDLIILVTIILGRDLLRRAFESQFSKVLKEDPFHLGTHKPIPVESHEKRARVFRCFSQLMPCYSTLV